ncbi:MAG: Flp pilus assembly protein TadG [Microvirga sp.]|nr:Flp pilus assembly protein TadG [Microvirga sp.]
MSFAPIVSFKGDQRGGVAVVLGFALPVLLLSGSAALEYGHLVARRAQIQKAADGAALAGARELMLANADDARVITISRSAALDALANGRREGASATVSPKVLNKRMGVQVEISETVPSLMGKVMSLPSTEVGVRSAASLSGSARICVIGLDTSKPETIGLNKDAKLTAENCSVFSNSKHSQGIKSDANALLKAERICSAGGYVGKKAANFSPAPVTDCPPMGDPLANRSPPPAGGCDYNKVEIKGGAATLTPGVYCGGLKITDGAKVHLSQGTFVIDGGKLVVDKGASLEGEYVGFYLRGDKSTFDFAFDSTVSLSAPKTGPMAGMLFFDDRTTKIDKHRIYSDNARKLLGTIYLSNSTLYIDAKKPVADQSAYTIIVARQLELYSGPNLVLNANYGASDVPVPKGVGPVAATAVNLSQ